MGRTSVIDESRSGRPSKSHTEEYITIREDRRITLGQVAVIVGLRYGSAQNIVHDGLDGLT